MSTAYAEHGSTLAAALLHVLCQILPLPVCQGKSGFPMTEGLPLSFSAPAPVGLRAKV